MKDINNMKTVAILTIACLVSTSALADRHVTYDYATVIDTSPIVKHVRVSTPREECWREDVVYRDSDHDGHGVGTVLGAVVGGALGNAVGSKKKNKQVGAVVGAVLGGTIGNAIAKENSRNGEVQRGTEEFCRVVNDYHEEEKIVGYRVRYRYNNETYTTRSDRDPGDTIKIRLAISPVI